MSLLRSRTSAPDGANGQADANGDASATKQHTHLARLGDVVIIQEKYDALKPVTLEADGVTNNRYGRYVHADMLGRPLGRRIKSVSNAKKGRQSSAGFVHALAPTPELWSQAMDHRTQIVYPHDAALIALLLDLRPGSVLVESGTGSGSASMAFVRVIAPAGRLHTFEFHFERAVAAQNDFFKLGVADLVRVSGGVDVVKHGFTGVADGAADAVFLDLPVPYAMGPEVARVLRPDGAACFFSPCVEQVQRTCEMLRKSGFHSIRTVTAPVKTYETREMRFQTPGFDDLSSVRAEPAHATVAADGAADEPAAKKRRRAEDVPKPLSEKELKSRTRTAGAERLAIGSIDGAQVHVGRVMRPKIRVHSKPYWQMKGHTSYLTFARRARGAVAATDGQHVANGVGQGPKGTGRTTGEPGKPSAEELACGMT